MTISMAAAFPSTFYIRVCRHRRNRRAAHILPPKRRAPPSRTPVRTQRAPCRFIIRIAPYHNSAPTQTTPSKPCPHPPHVGRRAASPPPLARRHSRHRLRRHPIPIASRTSHTKAAPNPNAPLAGASQSAHQSQTLLRVHLQGCAIPTPTLPAYPLRGHTPPRPRWRGGREACNEHSLSTYGVVGGRPISRGRRKEGRADRVYPRRLPNTKSRSASAPHHLTCLMTGRERCIAASQPPHPPPSPPQRRPPNPTPTSSSSVNLRRMQFNNTRMLSPLPTIHHPAPSASSHSAMHAGQRGPGNRAEPAVSSSRRPNHPRPRPSALHGRPQERSRTHAPCAQRTPRSFLRP
ncbi:hypothetical protein BJ912DRAFT_231935 [Pholiota molesta]|nr:hypothetical protein BJ912DRAFT_231935 [Pholiota molesta]